MIVNTEQTKVIMRSEPITDESQNNKIFRKGQELEKVTTFEYLGLLVTKDAKIDVEIANGTNKAKIYYVINKAIIRKTKKEEIQKYMCIKPQNPIPKRNMVEIMKARQ